MFAKVAGAGHRRVSAADFAQAARTFNDAMKYGMITDNNYAAEEWTAEEKNEPIEQSGHAVKEAATDNTAMAAPLQGTHCAR